jgi:peptide/nickel transport system substrate-binding protein
VAIEISPDNVAELRSAGRKIVSGKSGRVMQFALMCKGPLQEKRVRQALNMALDLRTIIDSIYSGFADLSEGQLVTRGVFGFDTRVKAYPYDPDRARALLREAGYPNGFTLKMSFSPGRYLNDKILMEAAMGYWSKIGVKVELQIMEAAVQSATAYAGKIDNAILTVFSFTPVMDLDFPAGNFTSDNPRQYGCRSKQYDTLYESSKSQIDPAKREVMLKQLGAIYRDEAWGVPLFELHDIFAVKPSVRFEPHPAFMWWPDAVGKQTD